MQYAPALFRHLKVVVDARRKRAGQYLLTGSQKFTLMKGVSESLAGRADIVELETLSLAEIQNAMRSTRLEAAMVRGGFPELHANPEIDPVAFYNSYLATYLERDRGGHGATHSTAAEAGDVAARAGVERLILTHVGAEYHDDVGAVAAEARRRFGGSVEVAEELRFYYF